VKSKEPAQYRKLCLHGLSVKVDGHAPILAGYGEHLLKPFNVSDLPERVVPTRGVIDVYDEREVVKHLSTAAQRVSQVDPWLELYQEGEQFWLVDERWGIAELNFLKGQWRSWVLPRPTADAVRYVEGSLMWPLAQLLRPRGLHLLPAISAAKDGWGVLILAAFSLEPELTNLLKAGYRIIGQRWTALRDEDGRIDLLHMPGVVERMGPPRLRLGSLGGGTQWVDLEQEFSDCRQHHAFCDAVVIIEPGRRAGAHASELSVPEAEEILRADWPILDLHPSRRNGQLQQQIAQRCRCAQVQLSRNPEDLVVLLDSMRRTTPGHRPEVALFLGKKRLLARAVCRTV
jgi:hypothetical protein